MSEDGIDKFDINGLEKEELTQILKVQEKSGFYSGKILAYEINETNFITDLILSISEDDKERDEKKADIEFNKYYFNKTKAIINKFNQLILKGYEVNERTGTFEEILVRIFKKTFEILNNKYGNNIELILDLNKESEKNTEIYNEILRIITIGFKVAFKNEESEFILNNLLNHKEYITYRLIDIFNNSLHDIINNSLHYNKKYNENDEETNKQRLEAFIVDSEIYEQETKNFINQIIEEEKIEEEKRIKASITETIREILLKYDLNIEILYDRNFPKNIIQEIKGLDNNFVNDLHFIFKHTFEKLIIIFNEEYKNTNSYKKQYNEYKKNKYILEKNISNLKEKKVIRFYIDFLPIIKELNKLLEEKIISIIEKYILKNKNNDLLLIKDKQNYIYITDQLIDSLYEKVNGEEIIRQLQENPPV